MTAGLIGLIVLTLIILILVVLWVLTIGVPAKRDARLIREQRRDRSR